MKKTLALLTLITINQLTASNFREHSLIFYPQFDWLGSALEKVAADKLVDGDYIVYPHYRGLIGSFRSEQYNINKEKVLLGLEEVSSMSLIKNDIKKHQDGIGGMWVNEFNPDVRFSGDLSVRRKALKYGQKHGFEILRCLDYETAMKSGNGSFVANFADQVVIFHDRALLQPTEGVISFYKEKSKSIREAHPEAVVLAAFELKLENNNLEEILQLMDALKDDADGFAVMFRNSGHQMSTAIDLLDELRS